MSLGFVALSCSVLTATPASAPLEPAEAAPRDQTEVTAPAQSPQATTAEEASEETGSGETGSGVTGSGVTGSAETETGSEETGSAEELEPLVIYHNGLRSDWQDYGWSPRDVLPGQPARVDFFDHGGWIIGGRETEGDYQELRLWVRAPASWGHFLTVRLSASGVSFPAVRIGPAHTLLREQRWREIRVPYRDLNPDGVAFDTITVSANRPVPAAWVYINNIVLEPDVSDRGTGTGTPLAAVGIDDNLMQETVAEDVEEIPDMIGVAIHVGGGAPAGGGSGLFAAGLSARLSFAEGFIALGVSTSITYHSLTVQAGDLGIAIDARSNVVTWPTLGVLTLRLPLGPVAIYGQTGVGAAWVWASRKSLDASQRASTTTWAVQGTLGLEVPVGPGWIGLESGYLILPSIELGRVLQQYRGGGVVTSLLYRLGV